MSESQQREAKYLLTPEGFAPYDGSPQRPEPLRRRSVSSVVASAGVAGDVHKRCREELLRLLQELEDMERAMRARLEEKDAALTLALDGIAARDAAAARAAHSLQEKTRAAAQAEEENAYLKGLTRNTNADLERLLGAADEKLRRAARDAAELRAASEALRASAERATRTLCVVHAMCDAADGGDADAAVGGGDDAAADPASAHEQRMRGWGVCEVAASAERGVRRVCSALRSRAGDAEAEVAALRARLAAETAAHAAEALRLRAELAEARADLNELRDEGARAGLDKEAALKKMKDEYERLLAEARARCWAGGEGGKREASVSPRNPRHWVPTGGGLIYQDLR